MLKVLQKKYKVTQSKVSKLWVTYRKDKEKVLKNKRLSPSEKKALRDELLSDTYSKVSESYSGYREKKYSLIYKSPYDNFTFAKTIRTQNTIQKIYKARRGYSKKDLDKIVPSVLDEPNVTGVLVVFRVESEETGQRQYVSNYITKDLLERIQQNGQTVFEYVAERLRAGNTKDYNLKFIYLRIIYEKPKNRNPKNESRKNKV